LVECVYVNKLVDKKCNRGQNSCRHIHPHKRTNMCFSLSRQRNSYDFPCDFPYDCEETFICIMTEAIKGEEYGKEQEY
jgi:hypothetical protein